MKNMNILLASSNAAVIRRWRDLFLPLPVDKASNAADVRRRCQAKRYDLVVLHRALVDLPAFTALRRDIPDGRFFLLSDQPSEEEGLSFLKAGIAGYGNTYMAKERLMEAARIITAGGVWLGQKVIQRLIMDVAARATDKPPLEDKKALAGLTKMERKVAGMVARGLTNLEIASQLHITERTIKAHLTSVYQKTQTGNRLSLALLVNRQD